MLMAILPQGIAKSRLSALDLPALIGKMVIREGQAQVGTGVSNDDISIVFAEHNPKRSPRRERGLAATFASHFKMRSRWDHLVAFQGRTPNSSEFGVRP